MPIHHKPRLTPAQQIANNRAQIAGLAKLAGKPPPVFHDIKSYKPKPIQISQLPEWLPLYGNRAFRGDCPLEMHEQKAFVKAVRKLYPQTWGKLITHIKNEGQRSELETYHDIGMGMMPGAADILIIAKTPLVLELKRRDPTKSSFSQDSISYLQAAQTQGAFVCGALGFDGAWAAFEAWLNIHGK